MLILLLLLMLIRVPIAFSLGITSLLFLWGQNLVSSPTPLMILPQKMVNGVESFPLLAIPFFMLAGDLMNETGITSRLVAWAKAVVGHLTGGLAQVSILVNVTLAGMSGSAIADASASGSMLIPAMKKAGYKPSFAAAIIATSSTIGPIIPPSIPFIIIGATVGISVAQLFIAGIIPGLLMGTLLMITVFIISKKRGYGQGKRATRSELFRTTKEASLAFLMPIIILGGIFSGIVTPTESALVAVWYAIIVGGFIYKELTWKKIYDICVRVINLSSIVMVIIATATTIGWLVSVEGLSDKLTSTLGQFHSPWLILVFCVFIFLFMGLFMDPIPIILILSPVLFPIIMAIGIDPIHFGVVMTVAITMGVITPPVGSCLFIGATISGTNVTSVVRELIPFYVALLVALAIIIFLPGSYMWLVDLVR